jgi:hypothetical protein
MIRRCNDEDNQDYAAYGGRGIKVCQRWLHDIDNFISDMGPYPGQGYTVDRIDNDGDYGPDNCRWATKEEQANNRDHVKKHEYKGEHLSIAQVSRLTRIPYSTLFDRVVRYGMTMDEAVSTPIRRRASTSPLCK